MKSDNNRLMQNTLMLYLMTFGKYLLPLVTLPYLTRVLSPEYYGVTTYMTSTMTFFQVFVDFGFLYSSTKEASLHRNDTAYLAKILSGTIVAKLLLCFLGAIGVLLIVPFVEILRENLTLTILYYISVAVTILIPDYIYRGLEKMQIVSMRFLLSRLVSTALTFVLIRSSADILWMPVLTIMGNLAAVVFSYIHLYHREKIRFCRVSIAEVALTLKKSSVFFAATFATTAYGALTTFLMGTTDMTTTEIAFWGLAYQIVTTIQMLYDPIISSLYPHMIQKRDFSLIRKVLYRLMPVIILGVICCYAFAPWGIRLVGGVEYMEATPIFRLLLPVLILSFPAQLLGFPVLSAMNKEKWATLSTIISAVFHCVGLVLLLILGRFTLIYVSILRVCTDCVLLLSRVIIFKTAIKKIDTI